MARRQQLAFKAKQDFRNALAIVSRKKDTGEILQRRMSYNVVVNNGRTWVRGLLGAADFDFAPVGVPAYPGEAGSPWTVDAALLSPGGPFNNYRLRYMALGTGGMFAVGGSFQESVHVSTLETPAPLDDPPTTWLKQILPSPTLADPEVFPTAYDFVARCVWDSTDISYAPAVSVDVTEIMVCTSAADHLFAPNLTNYPTGFPGIAAYNCFAPVTKDQSIVLEAYWFWRV